MKRIAFLIFALALTSMFTSSAEDLVQQVEVPSGWDASFHWCNFNNVGCNLPVFAEKNGSILNVKIFNNDWSLRSTFSITGLTEEDVIASMTTDQGDGNNGYGQYFIVSQYFFNDDDKYEIAIANKNGYSLTNIRVINEEGINLGNLPEDYDTDKVYYKVLGNRHYIVTNRWDDVKYYSIPGQTGAPMIRNNNDTNGDGTVTASDVTSVYNEILGL